MKKIILLCTSAVIFPTAAFAQSTGTQETEKDAIVITGTRKAPGTDGVVIQDSTKAKGLLTQEFIAKQVPGQSVLNTINYVAGVNFTQNDAYGSSGGNIRIRGFDGNRISLTFDGTPLNDSGNYAIFSNQQVDPEVIEQVNVNLGATDVDSPTASAAGGTVNLRTMNPTVERGVRMTGSLGTDHFRRLFGMYNLGTFTSFGTRAWLSASTANYNHWRGNGEIDKWQFNGKIYQPLGSNGDFITLAGHYNRNRNNNYNNPNLTDLRAILGATVVPTTFGGSPLVVGEYSSTQWNLINNLAYPSSCLSATGTVQFRPNPGPGAQSDPATCFTPGGPLVSQASTNLLGLQINPSNTANIRATSRFTLAPNLILTVDPTYQYVLANGGTQSVLLREADTLLSQGVVGSTGVDLNRDGDTFDTLLVGRPSITNTNRFTLLSSLVWKPAPDHTLRLSYTFDRAHHRQTGEYTVTDANFNLGSPFFGRNGTPIITAAGTVLQNRDRTSIAKLNQLSGQYIGKFIDSRLRVELGLRSPWFQRDLDQNCYTPAAGGGFPVCVVPGAIGTTGVTTGNYLVPNNYVPPAAGLKGIPVYAPFQAKYKFHKLLPNIGATFAINNSLSVFGSYSQGFSAPRTDNLYRKPQIDVIPESTNSFDLGLRYINRRLQAQATVWKIDYKNRIVSSFDPVTNISVDRNVGKVKSWGFDGSVGVKPTNWLNLLGLVSYTNAKLQQDVISGFVSYVPVALAATPTTNAVAATLAPPATVGLTYYCPGLPSALPTAAGVYVYTVCGRTAGKFVVETPKWQVGGRVELNFKPVVLGIQAKRVGRRFATDVNDVVTKGYTLVDLDARLDLASFIHSKSYLQLNVVNLFNERYFGNLSTSINAFGTGGSSAPRFTPGSPRAVSATLNFAM